MENNFGYEKIDLKEDKIVSNDVKIAFLFTGQGSQYVNMGEELYNTNYDFRNAFDECDSLFNKYMNISLNKLLYSNEYSNKDIERTLYAQPLIFTIEYSLSKMWRAIGINSDIVLGHSIGEYAAAVEAGILSLNDAIKLVAARSRLMDSAPGSGGMVSLASDENCVNELIKDFKDSVSIAVNNSQNNVVISGEISVIDKIIKIADENKVRAISLQVSHGFHSKMMNPILDEFHKIAEDVEYNESKTIYLSSYYGRVLYENEVIGADYWTNHIAEKVDFYKAIKSIEDKKNIIFIEVGPNKTLCSLVKTILGIDTVTINSLEKRRTGLKSINSAIEKLKKYRKDIEYINDI